MTEQKLKAYRFYTKMRYKETNKIVKEQFIIVAHNIKEAKELFELAIEHKSMTGYCELIEISEIKRDFSKKWNNPYDMAHIYEVFMEFKKNIQEGEK